MKREQPQSNSLSLPDFRSYSGGDARLVIHGDRLQISVRSHKRFIYYFGFFFLPILIFAIWFQIPAEHVRWSLLTAGAVLWIAVKGTRYGLHHHNQSLGDFLIVDRAGRLVTLPRLKREFPFEQIAGLQLARRDLETDLNLLVKDGETTSRYFIMGSPPRDVVQQLVAFADLPFVESNLGWDGYRDAPEPVAPR